MNGESGRRDGQKLVSGKIIAPLSSCQAAENVFITSNVSFTGFYHHFFRKEFFFLLQQRCTYGRICSD